MRQVLQIAIDGPVAAGKSTVAKALAEKLNLLYVDTGAMYRAAALAADMRLIAWSDVKRIEEMISEVRIELRRPKKSERGGRGVIVMLDGDDVTWKIRTAEIAEGASIVSQYAQVRSVLGKIQQDMAKDNDVVMEGRDIGTRVMPEASLKIYMTADMKKRARWKKAQITSYGQDLTLNEVEKGILKRDNREMQRENDPLRPAKGAWILDTTDLTIDEVVEVIVGRIVDLGFKMN